MQAKIQSDQIKAAPRLVDSQEGCISPCGSERYVNLLNIYKALINLIMNSVATSEENGEYRIRKEWDFVRV